MNRFFRRLQSFGKKSSGKRSQSEMTNASSEMTNTSSELIDANTPQDVTSTRAKNERHGKVTADKWNQ